MSRVRVTTVSDPELNWDDPATGRYLAALEALGPDGALANARYQLAALQLPDRVFPLVLPEGQQGCWLTSLTVTHGRALRDEIPRHLSGVAALGARAVCLMLEALLRACRVDHSIYVNHLLFSTSLYGGWTGDGLEAALRALRAEWPDRAILLRSLNTADHADLLSQMTAHGARLLPSRVVWRIPEPGRQWAPRTDVKADLKLASAGGYRLETTPDPSPAEIDDILGLYAGIYLAKYSRANPAYSAAALGAAVRTGALRLVRVRAADGAVVAFVADHVSGGELSSPLLGYDRDRPTSDGLYRIVMAAPVQRAVAEGLAVNYSAGAERFKRHRGAGPALEYLAVFDGHLPGWRRLGYAVLARALGLIKPMLERMAAA